MTAKEYLLQYKILTERQRQLDAEIEAYEAQIESGAHSDGLPRGSDVSDVTGRIASALADIKSAYEWARYETWQKRREIVETINKVDNADHARVLYSKYILLKKWSDIAQDIYRSEAYTRGRLHADALRAVDKIINSNG